MIKIRKILAVVLLVFVLSLSVMAIVPDESQAEPIYVGSEFFVDTGSCVSTESVISSYSGCNYFCSWCTISSYQCNARGSCC